MATKPCTCPKWECTCNNGWGYFKTEAELLAAIGAEIRAEERRLAGGYGSDDDAVIWMIEEGYTDEEIAGELGVPLGKVRRVMRTYDY